MDDYNEQVSEGNDFEYDPSSTDPDVEFEEEHTLDTNDGFDVFEFNEMMDFWRE
jgi:hypothetical protein